VAITDENIGVSQLLGHMPGLPPKSTPMMVCLGEAKGKNKFEPGYFLPFKKSFERIQSFANQR